MFNKIPNIRTAVLISGYLRTFEKTYGSFLANILNPLQADVFVHTWETLGSPASKQNSDAGMDQVATMTKIDAITKIINPVAMNIETHQMYNIKSQIIEKIAILNEQDRGGLPHRNLVSYGSMLYSWNQVRRMVEKYERNNGFEYDMMIRLRTDCNFTKKINILNYNKDNLYVPQIGKYFDDGMNDQFAVGNGKNIKTYMNMYEHLLFYVNNRVCVLRPESLLRYHMKANGIQLIEDAIEFNIIRPDNNVVTQTVLGQRWSKP